VETTAPRFFSSARGSVEMGQNRIAKCGRKSTAGESCEFRSQGEGGDQSEAGDQSEQGDQDEQREGRAKV
jgi:hypothetical protein